MTRRFEAGPLLAALGAVVLLVGLFLEWYDPGLTAWEALELLDAVLAAIGVAAILCAAGALGWTDAGPRPAALPWLAGAALLLVGVSLVDGPPAVAADEPQVGLWLALAGVVVLAAGALLTATRVTISVDVEPRERVRVSAVPTGAPTEPLPPEPAGAPRPADGA